MTMSLGQQNTMVLALEDDAYGLGDLPKNFAYRQTDTHTHTETPFLPWPARHNPLLPKGRSGN